MYQHIEFTTDMYIAFETDRLKIREFSPNDFYELYKVVTSKGFHFYAFPDPESVSVDEMVQEVRRFLERTAYMRIPDETTKMRENLKLAVCLKSSYLKEDGKLIGYVAVDEISESRGEKRDIGYFIHSKYWGRGYATEAVRELLNRVAYNLPSDHVYATVHPDNIASRKVLANTGFEGPCTRTINKAGEPRLVYHLNIAGYLSPRAPQTERTNSRLRSYFYRYRA